MLDWRKLIGQYEAGVIVLRELKWRLFESFQHPEQAREFLAEASDPYQTLLRDHCYPADNDDAGWANILFLGSNTSREEMLGHVANLRAGVKNYRSA